MKSGASAQLDKYNPVETLTSSAITSQVLTVSDSTCPVIVAQLEPLIAQVTLRVPSISTLPSVSKALIEVVQFTVKSSDNVTSSPTERVPVIVSLPVTASLPATVTSLLKIAFQVVVEVPVTV
jgi:hypothetical protein